VVEEAVTRLDATRHTPWPGSLAQQLRVEPLKKRPHERLAFRGDGAGGRGVEPFGDAVQLVDELVDGGGVAAERPVPLFTGSADDCPNNINCT